MSYRPPQKRAPKVAPKDDFPALATVSVSSAVPLVPETNPEPKNKMNFASLFKNAIKKKNKVKKLKWGTVLLTKKGMIDSLTPEERAQEEEFRDKEIQEERMWKMCCRLDQQQNVRRIYDPNYESPEEWSESESEEEEEEEEEVLTDDYEEDEFEPDI
jgi:hypothetical protein